jgi:DNA-binding transcriptional ArsR family regulator
MNQSMFEIQAEFCKAMGNTVRLQLLHVLREHSLTVTEICQETGLPQGTVSRQLTVLRGVGVVVSRRHGSTKAFEITNKKIPEVCDLVRSILVEQIQKRSQSIE